MEETNENSTTKKHKSIPRHGIQTATNNPAITTREPDSSPTAFCLQSQGTDGSLRRRRCRRGDLRGGTEDTAGIQDGEAADRGGQRRGPDTGPRRATRDAAGAAKAD